MAGAITAEDPELEQTAWDLQPLVQGEGEAGVMRLLDQAHELADTFAERHAGAVAERDGAELAEAMGELSVIYELIERAGSYAGLSFSTDTADPARGALMQSVEERVTVLQTKLLFFDLEWAAVDETQAESLLVDPRLDFCRHHLRTVRRYRTHLLSEPEEKIYAEKALTGRNAWARLFEELTAAVQVTLPADGDADPEGGAGGGAGPHGGANGGEDRAPAKVALDVALSRLALPDRGARRTAAEAVTEALAPGLRTRAYVFNTLLVDKAVDDRLRHYPSWLSARNLANEASDESVRALVDAVRARYELPRRWYRLKARLLGLERLADYDRMAPVTQDDITFPWSEGRELVLNCYSSFSGELGDLARRFFDERWIDAPVRPGKRGGAFCASGAPSVHPYVLLNYTSRRRDVLTLAHELGHGVHFALAAGQGVFHQNTPLTLAETASVFGETIVFGRLLEADQAPASRLALLAEHLEGAIATVFRQVAMNRFEETVHTARREEGELSVDRLSGLWSESQREMLGDSVELTPGYETWWSYVPHFINTPGYVYAYAYGQLLALSVYERYTERGEDFVEQYLALLRAGGSRSPEELGALVDVDLADPGFWDAGLALVERQLEEAEQAAEHSGRL